MKSQNLTQGGILKSLVTFAFPVLLALFLQVMYGAADLIIVGQFAGTGEQSGVASGSQLFHLVTLVITGLTMGVTVLVGNAIGARDPERAGRGIGAGIAIFAVIAVAVTAVVVPWSDGLASLLDAPPEAFAQTSSYVRICGIGTVFIVAYNVIGAVFRGIGDSRTPLLTVAIATVTAQAVSVIVSLVLIRRKELPFTFHRFYVRFDPVYVRAILRVGIPIALQELLVQFSFLFIQVVVNGMGVTQSAAVGVAEKAVGFLMLVGSAYMQSISAFVAQNNGAGQYNRSKKALFYGIETAFAAGVVMAALAFFGGGALASLFSREAAVIAGAHEYLKAYAFDCLLTAIFFCYVGYFNGCGKTIFVMAQGVIGAFCVRVPAVFLLSRAADASLFRIGLATPLSSLVQIFLCLGAYRYYQKKGLGLPTEARQID